MSIRCSNYCAVPVIELTRLYTCNPAEYTETGDKENCYRNFFQGRRRTTINIFLCRKMFYTCYKITHRVYKMYFFAIKFASHNVDEMPQIQVYAWCSTLQQTVVGVLYRRNVRRDRRTWFLKYYPEDLRLSLLTAQCLTKEESLPIFTPKV